MPTPCCWLRVLCHIKGPKLVQAPEIHIFNSRETNKFFFPISKTQIRKKSCQTQKLQSGSLPILKETKISRYFSFCVSPKFKTQIKNLGFQPFQVNLLCVTSRFQFPETYSWVDREYQLRESSTKDGIFLELLYTQQPQFVFKIKRNEMKYLRKGIILVFSWDFEGWTVTLLRMRVWKNRR